VLQEFVETWLLEPLALAAAEPAERFGPVLQRRNFQREESRSNFRGTDACEVDLPIGPALALPDMDDATIEIEVTPADSYEFAYSHSGGVHQAERQFVAQGRRGLQQVADF